MSVCSEELSSKEYRVVSIETLLGVENQQVMIITDSRLLK